MTSCPSSPWSWYHWITSTPAENCRLSAASTLVMSPPNIASIAPLRSLLAPSITESPNAVTVAGTCVGPGTVVGGTVVAGAVVPGSAVEATAVVLVTVGDAGFRTTAAAFGNAPGTFAFPPARRPTNTTPTATAIATPTIVNPAARRRRASPFAPR